ncbi:MAG TPA: HAD family acid phosphatase, partial [Puia sp.]|nr:HAD family acid phosphatase [Puia sp.]
RDKKNYTRKPFAIVTDLDETALDNSGNEAWLYVNDSAYNPAEFDHWSVAGDPGIVPGSVDFFKYVDGLRDLRKRKLHIYYVSNRTDTPTIVEGTRQRMHALGFPQTDDASNFRFQPKGSTSSKEPRRLQIAETDTIMLLLGDNLIDLSKVFDGTAADSATRMRRVDSMAGSWGKQYIVFPNAEYGDWEKTLYPGGKYLRLGDEQGIRKKDLKPSGWQ